MHKKQLVGLIVGVGIIVSAVVPLSRLLSETSPLISYLQSKPLSPWSIMALSAAGKDPSLESLKSVSSAKAIDLEAPILALTAAGEDPRTFGPTDLIAKLKTFFDGTQLGEADILNDDVFGLLALVSSGEPVTGNPLAVVKNFVLSKQNDDGGFGFALGGASDTNTTSAAIMALRAAGVAASDHVLQKALAYLTAAQNDDGGIPYDPKSPWGTDSDASSDAWVIMALRSLGVDSTSFSKNGLTPISHLKTLEQQNGSVLYQAGGQEDGFTPVTTSYALLAFSGKTLPVRTIVPETPAAVAVTFRLEGAQATLCKGEGEAVLALDTIALAEKQCGISAHIAEAAFGKYVDEIAGEKASGSRGWMYFVSNEMPSVGAAAYTLKSGDEVLWYFGAYGWQISRVRLSKESYQSGAPVTGTAEHWNSSWKPIEGASVEAAGKGAETDTSGNFSLSLPDGRHEVFIRKDGYIRSSGWVTVGEPLKTTLELEATISGSTASTPDANDDSPEALSLTIETVGSGTPGSFGEVAPGSVAKRDVRIKNGGAYAVALSASVEGDSLFRTYLTLSERSWRSYRGELSKGEATTTTMALAIPGNYGRSGKKTGALIIWATPAAQ